MLVAVFALLVLVLTAVQAVRRPGLITVACLVSAAVLWMGVNRAVEGPVLMALSPNHGLHVADLVSLLIVGQVGIAVAARGVGRRGEPPATTPLAEPHPRQGVSRPS